MLKKHFLILGILSLSIAAAFAQKLENSTLWKITGNGLDAPSYLFGTIHITCDATLNEGVKKALDETEQLVLELDMDDPKMQGKMMSNMYMKEGKTLKDFVTDKEFTLIDSLFIKNLGMSVKMMQNVKPFFLSSSLYPKMIDCPMQSFELELVKIAQQQKEEIKGLETIESQLQIFDEIPYEEQISDLIRSAKDNLAYSKVAIKKLLEAYDKQDINAMLEMTGEDEDSPISKYQEKLLDERNKKWIPKIGEFAKEKPTFFGVGAGHLAGKNGVIFLLRKAGYTVTAVK